VTDLGRDSGPLEQPPGGLGTGGVEPSGLAGAGMDLDVAVAAVLADNSDVKMLLRVLGKSLADTVGDRVEIEQSGGGLLRRSQPEVRSITVHLDPDDYIARLDGRGVRCSIGRSSGGIRIRNEQLPVEQWLHRLLSALQAEAETNQSARAALENIVIGGST
jgi:hypothetical protein